MAKNVLGTDLKICCENPMTGFFRNGKCDTLPEDLGMHTVCVLVTKDFLEFSSSRGNDLSTPIPAYQFQGLVSGDHWCLCLTRWLEAHEVKMAPQIDLEACHISVLEHIEFEELKKYAI